MVSALSPGCDNVSIMSWSLLEMSFLSLLFLLPQHIVAVIFLLPCHSDSVCCISWTLSKENCSWVSIYGVLLLGIQQQGQMATNRLTGIDFQYQCRLHRFIFAVPSVIPWFLEMPNSVLNIFLLCCVHVCVCSLFACVLMCACVCLYVHACAGEPLRWQDSSCFEGDIVTLLLSSEHSMALWWVHREVLVWCELFWSWDRYAESKSTWINLYFFFFPLCLYCCIPYLLLFSLFPDNPNKQCFIPSSPTSACTVTTLWT